MSADSFSSPGRLSPAAAPLPWSAQVPFLYDLVAELRPVVFVALGAFSREGYLAACQAACDHTLGAACYAVHLQPDGLKGENDDGAFRAHHAAHFQNFSHLLQADDFIAQTRFAEAPIDLLHLAVSATEVELKEKIAPWLAFLRPGGVLFAHGVAPETLLQVQEDAAHWLAAGRTMTLPNGATLGIYRRPSSDPDDELPPLPEGRLLGALFGGEKATLAALRRYETLAYSRLPLLAHGVLEDRPVVVQEEPPPPAFDALNAAVARERERADSLANELTVERGRLRNMRASFSWKLTLPLRALGRALSFAPPAAGLALPAPADGGPETAAASTEPALANAAPGGIGYGYYHSVERPQDWTQLRDRRVLVSGWATWPLGERLVKARVVCNGDQITEGRFGFPRYDVAANLHLDRERENCGFEVPVELPLGLSQIQVEVGDETGKWHKLLNIQAEVHRPRWPAALGFGALPAPTMSPYMGIDVPTDWNLLDRSLRLAGWCLAPDGGAIMGVRAVAGDKVAEGLHGFRRPDVALTQKLAAGRERCGFEVYIEVPGGRSEVQLEVKDAHGVWHPVGRFPVRAPRRSRALRFAADTILDYNTWVKVCDRLTPQLRRWIVSKSRTLPRQPLISVVMPVYNTPEHWLVRALESVRAQLYPNWELCVADDASTAPHIRPLLEKYARRDPRIKVLFREKNGHIAAASNSALEMATGEYVALLDHDDELNLAALFAVADELNDFPEAELLYSDEDKLNPDGHRYDPYFKPDWNPDLLLGQNYLCHLMVVKTELLRAVGGFRAGFDGCQDWDLALRVSEQLAGMPAKIRHIPRVLYHWRAIPGSTALALDAKDNYVRKNSRRALLEHFERTGQRATVEDTPEGYYRTRFALPQPPPLVSIIIPTRNGLKLLKQCVKSLLADDTYPHYEVIVVDNDSDDPGTLAWLRDLPSLDPRLRSVPYRQPFNYSAINNFAVREHARGEIVLLLNNDIEVLEPGWLGEMTAHAARPEIGCVGALLYYPDDRIQHAGVVLGLGGVAGHAFKYYPKDSPTHGSRGSLVQNYTAVTAACLAVRREVFLQVGGLDEEKLTVAFNDIDFCLKVHALGLRNLWTPFAVLRHHESASRGQETTPERIERFGAEIETMRDRWEALLQDDPAYNPNLTLLREDFSFAAPPRHKKTWGR